MKFRTQVLLTFLALATLAVVDRAAHAVRFSASGGSGATASPYFTAAPPAPQHGVTVTLNGSVETIQTLTDGTCYLISTNGKDLYFYGEDAVNTGTAGITDHRLPDPGVEKVCLVTGNTKLHFFASAATTATVAQTGP